MYGVFFYLKCSPFLLTSWIFLILQASAWIKFQSINLICSLNYPLFQITFLSHNLFPLHSTQLTKFNNILVKTCFFCFDPELYNSIRAKRSCHFLSSLCIQNLVHCLKVRARWIFAELIGKWITGGRRLFFFSMNYEIKL